jgi:hypothetical protein
MFQKEIDKCFTPEMLIGHEKKIYLYLKEKSYGFVSLIAKDLGMNKYTCQFVLDKLWQNRLVERVGVRQFVERNSCKHIKKPKKFIADHQKEFAQPRLNVYMIDIGAIIGDSELRTDPQDVTIEGAIFKESK